MKLERQLKIALDESRLLILGSQVIGFQFNGIFQPRFEGLPFASRAFMCAGLSLIMLAIALLIAPAMERARTRQCAVCISGLKRAAVLL
jgi:hypothetical protein